MIMIKIIFYSTLFIGLCTSCNNQREERTVASESIQWNENREDATTDKIGKIEIAAPEFNFGTIKEGEKVEHVFTFKNVGNAPVILVQVSASCGCTTPNYTREPVLPGKEGEIKVSFDSEGQTGMQQKIVTISSNAENRVTTVQLKGIVENK